jgi:hypothetical protein
MTRKMMGLGMAVAGALLSQVAVARTVPASSGRPVNWNDGPCFGLSYSTVTNSCSTTKHIEYPLPVDNAGSKTVYITGYGATSSNNVGCGAAGMNREFTAVWASPKVWLSSFGSAQTITLTGAWVPSGGYLYAACELQPNGRVHVVEFNQ